uniref:Chromosome LG27 open reading frame, human C11orf24 n=1 Tax=Lepisosteus oculatus TaxID=7918 RepID=W5M3X5_LEPOC|nr:PREDICTED: uncharacterized protein C11orf24 homolog [Lepisosteus oculatus]
MISRTLLVLAVIHVQFVVVCFSTHAGTSQVSDVSHQENKTQCASACENSTGCMWSFFNETGKQCFFLKCPNVSICQNLTLEDIQQNSDTRREGSSALQNSSPAVPSPASEPGPSMLVSPTALTRATSSPATAARATSLAATSTPSSNSRATATSFPASVATNTSPIQDLNASSPTIEGNPESHVPSSGSLNTTQEQNTSSSVNNSSPETPSLTSPSNTSTPNAGSPELPLQSIPSPSSMVPPQTTAASLRTVSAEVPVTVSTNTTAAQTPQGEARSSPASASETTKMTAVTTAATTTATTTAKTKEAPVAATVKASIPQSTTHSAASTSQPRHVSESLPGNMSTSRKTTMGNGEITDKGLLGIAAGPLTRQLVDTSSLLAVFLFGLLFFLVTVVLFLTQAYESYKKKDYTQVDYLINGMYSDSGV